MSDAVFAFLAETKMPTEGEIAERAGEAGEHLARGLAMLVSTQFGGELTWTPTPLWVAAGRWRVRFGWAATTQTDETEDDDEPETQLIN